MSSDMEVRPVNYPSKLMESVKIMLRSLNMPADNFKWSSLTFGFVIINTIIMQIAHVTYMVLHITDLATMADTCSTVSTTFQVCT